MTMFLSKRLPLWLLASWNPSETLVKFSPEEEEDLMLFFPSTTGLWTLGWHASQGLHL